MNEKIRMLLNEQIAKELESAYLYLDFAGWFDAQGLRGFGNWYRVQAMEEKDHAMKIFDYLLEAGERPLLRDLVLPTVEVSCNRDVILAGQQHERYVTSLIHALCVAADDTGDLRTRQFLDWFVAEQQEEEANAQELVDRMDLAGDCRAARLMIDSGLSERKYAG